MYTIKEYHLPQNLADAYEIISAGRRNTILGGCLWLKMGHKKINKAVDLKNCGLDFIRLNNGNIEIGASATLRQAEKSPLLQEYWGAYFTRALKDIVGVQFRNCATIGGSVYGRYGFSDLLTALMALNCRVELFKGGIISLEDFLKNPPKRDILVKLILKPEYGLCSYKRMALSRGDFPLLTAAAAKEGQKWRLVLGARPQRAALCPGASAYLPDKPQDEEIKTAIKIARDELHFGTNMRGDALYRRELAGVLLERAIKEVIS